VIKSTGVELSDLTQFLILILILLLIFKRQEITIMMKSKIKRRKVAKSSLNSMAVVIKSGCGLSSGTGDKNDPRTRRLESLAGALPG